MLGAVAFADRESAEFFQVRGEKALKAKEWDEAEGQFRKALTEDTSFHLARLGLAEALLGKQDRAGGLAELRRFVQDARREDPLSAAWGRHLKRGERLLKSLDDAGNELDGRIGKHVSALMQFARKWQKKDADITVRALRQVLALRPGDAKAAAMIEGMGLSPKGEAVSLFGGESLDGWADMAFPTWQVSDGHMVGNVKDSAVIGRTEDVYEGDFDVRMEARIEDHHPGPSMFGVLPCYDGRDSHYTLGFLKGSVFWAEVLDEDTDRDIFHARPAGFDKDGWNTYELRFRGNRVVALVNGTEIGAEDRPAGRRGGFVGVLVQNCRFAIRKLDVTPR